MNKIYLDNNIVIDIKNLRNKAVVDAMGWLNRDEFQVVYGPAHIEEIAVTTMHHGQSEDSATDKLSFLAQLTDSTELLPFRRAGLKLLEQDGIFVYKEHPKRCYERVVAQYKNNATAEAAQLERLVIGKKIQEVTNITSLLTNDLDMQPEIDKAKPSIHHIVLAEYEAIKRAGSLTEYIPNNPPDCDDLKFSYTRNFFPIHEILLEKIFEFLVLRRFNPEFPEEHISGLHDTTHAIYAAYCDIFVSNDRRLREKAKAAYKWLGVPTLVLSRDEFVTYVSNEENGT